ncbi:hypothetical protein [Pontibacillus marinus]|uniref:DUF4825 domain-containing protein n=1 Tax=Pontibacillus marinus BH030004 = DSM 16465 TaxID=1385511 RepID=A0A0A5GL10_9BACI|nr:hypothetical protein [Pontibacillus marinus]KGX91903.1 hypothetical protein N783_00910 [Pontibacillus marinus BH030004 = DSM 16465]
MHKALLTIASLFMFAFLAGCGLEQKSFSQFYEGDLSEVTKVVITDGNTGYKKVVEKKPKIQALLEQIKDVQFIPDENQEERTGFNYSISLFEKGESTFQFGLTKVNDHYYHTEPDLYPIIDQFYKQLKVKKE